MGFFEMPEPEDDLEDEEEDDFFDDHAPWTGGVVPLDLVVARSDQAAVVVTHISAFPDGFAFTVESYLHRSVPRRRARIVHPHWDDDGEARRDEVLRFGLSWPDGGRATNIDSWGRRWPDATEPAHGLEENGGGGSDRHYSWEFWAWPLPGPGQLRFVVEWPAFGIPETAQAIDAQLLIDAAAKARPVWPDDGARPSHLTRAGVMGVLRRRSGGFEEAPATDE